MGWGCWLLGSSFRVSAALCAALTPALRQGLIHHPQCKAELVLMDGAGSTGNVSLPTARAGAVPRSVGHCQWAAALARGLASALAPSRDHRTVCPLCMGTGLSQSPAAPPHTSPSASSRLFSLASSYLFKRKKQQQPSLSLESIGEKVSLSPPLLFLGRCSFKLAVWKIK